MMDIVMLVAGAGIGAMLRDLFVLHRGDKNKTRQQLESKTPYDYALTNAIDERDRLRDELVTLRALNNVQTDTERIRNEIETIVSDDGEEPSEGVYDPNMSIDDLEYATETYASGIALGEWDEPYRSKFIQAIGRTSDGREYLTEQGVNPTADGREYMDGVIPTQKHADGTVSPILPQAGELDTSPMAAITGMSAAEAGWDAAAVSRAYARLGGNVREGDSGDEQSTEDDVERSLTKVVRESFKNKEIIRVTWRDSYGRLHFSRGSVDEIATGDGKVKEFGMRGLEIFAGDVEWIAKGGRNINGETLYRKGNR